MKNNISIKEFFETYNTKFQFLETTIKEVF